MGCLPLGMPVCSFTLLCASLSARSMLCVQLCLLHHFSLEPFLFLVTAWRLRLASGIATPLKVVLLVHAVLAHTALACHHALCIVGDLSVGHVLFAGFLAVVAQLLPALPAGISHDSCQYCTACTLALHC